ncbi:MAG: bacterioferritin [Halofilum sp. (in: g-proteobacteria)]|nr:bacterioferritin [Halofilum sp. (in: g-proteobacteria)]
MQGDKKVIEYLQKGLRSELTAVNQYILHSRMLEDWGLDKLSAKEHQEALEEMQHADRFIKRILFLEGLPNLQELDKLRVGEDVKEILEGDLAAEKDALALYREAMAYCEKAQDYASRDLFGELLRDEEDHHDFLETQLELIEQIGIQNYRQSQMDPAAGGE